MLNTQNPDCLFCKIVKGDIPSKIIYKDEKCVAFHDIDPQAPVHFLVIPKVHIGSCGEINGTNSLVSNCGVQAGQSVPHLHFHVLAGRDMTWPPG